MERRNVTSRDIGRVAADVDGLSDPAIARGPQSEASPLDAATLAELRSNPFLERAMVDFGDPETRRRLANGEGDMLQLRQLAAKVPGRRVVVFAMPKSGSSFVQTAVGRAANIPFLSLTSLPPDGGSTASNYGINGREQELDALALVLQTLRGRGSWVAQHHTRFNRYLAFQLRFWNIRPIVTVRNVFDAIVSMDDMIMKTRRTGEWGLDPPYALPLDYPELDRADRLALLSVDFGIWLIKFLLSWKRAIAGNLAYPLILSYEEDILHPEALGARLGDFLGLDDRERAALSAYITARPGEESRFNKGVTGRGGAVPPEARAMLEHYARRFRDELGEDGMSQLFG